MNINLKFLLCGAAVWLFPQYAAAQCAVTDCQQLGYTSLKSCTGGLKCPFGEYWACPEVEEKAVLGECTGYAKNCAIGQILNSDGTCSNDKVSGKTPIAVIVYIGSDNCGYAMTASPIATGVAWSTSSIDISGLPNYAGMSAAEKDFDVIGNMQKIIQEGNSNAYPAAWTAVNYAPSTAPETKGKWVLPSAGVLYKLDTNIDTINNTISKLGGQQITGYKKYIWSSSENSRSHVWAFCSSSAFVIEAVIKSYSGSSYQVWPVIEF